MKVVVVTGTPGTGKTTVAMRLAKKIGYKYVDVNRVISKEGLSSGYDRKRKCKVVDTKKLSRVLVKMIKGFEKTGDVAGVVIDSHLSHELSPAVVDLCVVTKCGLRLLKRRMKRRHYAEQKIKENLECEIFDVCLNDASESGHNVYVVETDSKVDYDKLARKVKRARRKTKKIKK
jgi:adenylate kinase